MPALPEVLIDKVIGWTPTGNTFRGKLATRYLFTILLAFSFVLMGIFWLGGITFLNRMLDKPADNGIWLGVLEMIICTPLVAVGWRGWLRARWTRKTVLTSDDVYTLIAYGKEVIKVHGKKISWEVIRTKDKPVTGERKDEGLVFKPRFPNRVRSNDVIGGILCAMYQEGGWEVLPKEAWSFFNEYPFAFRAFYSQYR